MMQSLPNLLVVDDNTDLLDTFSLILKRKGYNVDIASEGSTAIDKFKKHHYDVILMDVVMPGMNGVEAYRKIAEIDPSVKVILMTAYYDEEELKTALLEGVYRTVYKPVDIGHLMNIIKEALDNQPLLIIDDDIDFCKVMASGLTKSGYRVFFATSGEEALNMAKMARFEAAFIDMKMPGMDGLETSLKLKELDPGLFTILMTAYRDEVKDKMEQAQASACLFKPFDLSAVMELIKSSGR